MGKQNSKPGRRSAPRGLPERRLKVVAGFYEYPPTLTGPERLGRTRRVPQLRLKGQWLEQAGFALDTPVRVIVKPGRLVVEIRE